MIGLNSREIGFKNNSVRENAVTLLHGSCWLQLMGSWCQYEYHSEMLDKAMRDINDRDYDSFDNIAPNAEHINKQDFANKSKPSELFGCFDPGKNQQHSHYDLLDDMGIFPRSNDEEDLVIRRISDEQYRKLVPSLNEKQIQFFLSCPSLS